MKPFQDKKKKKDEDLEEGPTNARIEEVLAKHLLPTIEEITQERMFEDNKE